MVLAGSERRDPARGPHTVDPFHPVPRTLPVSGFPDGSGREASGQRVRLPERLDADPYDSRDLAQLVFAALRALPAQQRVMLVLRYWAGLSEQEIAVQLGCSTGTVKSRASRALAILRSGNGPLADAFVRTGAG